MLTRTAEQPQLVIAVLPRSDSPSADRYARERQGLTGWTIVPEKPRDDAGGTRTNNHRSYFGPATAEPLPDSLPDSGPSSGHLHSNISSPQSSQKTGRACAEG